MDPNTFANHIWHFVFMHILSIHQSGWWKKVCSLLCQKLITETFFSLYLSHSLTRSLDDNLSEKFKYFLMRVNICLRQSIAQNGITFKLFF